MPDHRPLISTQISRASAALLLLAGLALLFAGDVILPQLIPDIPAAATWPGQLLAAAWLGVATLNWLSRAVVLGGIYGRAVIATNAVLYFVSAMVLLNVATQTDASAAIWLLVAPAAIFGGIYAWLLFRGPFDRDLSGDRRA